VSTLEALALEAGDGNVWACLDARMNEVYGAAYEVAGEVVRPLVAPVCMPPALIPVPAFLRGRGVGDGFSACGGLLHGRKPDLVDVRPDLYPTAGGVLRLAAPVFLRGQARLAAEAQPVYVRDKVALTTAERIARGGAK
jgi:tRNA threonylcarbamoyladenosine biosynthesis protein TsaB